MTKKVINDFKGMIPKESLVNLPAGYADLAIDCHFDNRGLNPLRKNKLLKSDIQEEYQRVFLPYGKLLLLGCGTSVTEWSTDCERVYVTGRQPYPEVGILADDDVYYSRLGLPCPDKNLKITNTISAVGADENYYYSQWVYTLINDLGEESAPSPTSNSILHKDGESINLEVNIKIDSTYNNIIGSNLYRASTGFISGGEKEHITETEFLYVKTELFSGGVMDINLKFEDNLKLVDLDWVLSTRESQPPPAGLRGVILIEGTTTLCGFVGNKIYFSEPDEPNNWREEQELTLDDNIISLIEQNGVLFALTDGSPYFIDVGKGCNGRECRLVKKCEEVIPAVGCVGSEAGAKSKYGVLYVSDDGLYLAKKGVVENITKTLFTEEQWRKKDLMTMKVRVYKGMVVVFTREESFYFIPTEKSGVVMLSDKIIDAYISRTGEMVALIKRKDSVIKDVVQLFADTDSREYTWVSGLITENTHINFNVYGINKGVGRLDLQIINSLSDNYTGLSHREIIHQAFLTQHRDIMERITRYSREYGLRIVMQGLARVNRVSLGSRFKELS